jgi:hypothetical protein
MMKYINDDPMIRDFFPVMKRRLEDEIATLEDRASALRKTEPVVLGRSAPGQEQDS